jgi:hypothetical protein
MASSIQSPEVPFPKVDINGNTFQYFDGFPYLVTRVVGSLRHYIVLPELTGSELVRLAHLQVFANQLDTCLVLGAGEAVYIDAAGQHSAAPEPPAGGQACAERLLPPIAFPDDADFRHRQERLMTFIAKFNPTRGYILGDMTKGGRPATGDELVALTGRGSDGAPIGLSRCGRCHDWHGECLDPSSQFAGQVMQVHCLCANHNRCARCGKSLAERRLNANYYFLADDSIRHVPGFCGLSHRCRSEDYVG